MEPVAPGNLTIAQRQATMCDKGSVVASHRAKLKRMNQVAYHSVPLRPIGVLRGTQSVTPFNATRFFMVTRNEYVCLNKRAAHHGA